MYIVTSLVLATITLLLHLYWNLKKAYRYFDENGIPNIKPTSILGNMPDVVLFRKTIFDGYLELHKKAASYKFVGLYNLGKPFVMVRDPELIKQVLIKDFDHFQDHTFKINEKVEPLTNNLFSLKGHDWKNLRIKLTGTFTTGKMKMMFPLMEKCAEKMSDVLDKLASDGEEFEMKDICARYGIDVIGSCAFGVETHSLQNPNSEFRQMAKRMMRFRIQPIIRMFFPNMPACIIKWFGMHFFPADTCEYFKTMVENIVKYREKNNIKRFDFLDLLLAMKNNTEIEKIKDQYEEEDLNKFLEQIGDKRTKSNVEMTLDLMVSQCITFFIAGFEAAATMLTFTLIELAHNKDVQDKSRNEILSVLKKHDGILTYAALKEMRYLDMVLSETLRKYTIGFVDRQCSRAYKFPGTNGLIKEGTQLVISMYGLHHDPEHYEKPEEFYPEHFSEEAIARRHNFAYIPFGEGPRACIAERFGKMQVKVGMVHALKGHEYELAARMKMPLEFTASFGFINIKGGAWMKCRKI